MSRRTDCTVPCPHCGGTNEGRQIAADNFAKCPHCDESAQVPACPDCEGEGYDCLTCDGDGADWTYYHPDTLDALREDAADAKREDARYDC
jgi:hypothetical protein